MRHKDIQGPIPARIGIPAANAADATALVSAWRAPIRCTVTKIAYVPLTAVTGANTDSRTLNAKNGATVVATKAYTSGVNATALADNALTLSGTAANLNMAEGDVLAMESAKVGNGLALPAGEIYIEYQAR